MADKSTILVTGVGAVIGYGIIKSLRRAELPVRIVGMDIYTDAYGRHLADDFVQAVPAASEDYLPFLRRVIAEHHIDLIIPGIEPDLYALWRHRAELPTQVVLNTDQALELSRSKLATARYFADQPFVIPTLHSCPYTECVARLGLPFIFKLVSSHASKGLTLINDAVAFDFFTARAGVGKCVYQPRIGSDDEEYTVGAFGDGKGGYVDSIILRRRLAQDGSTARAWFVADDPAIRSTVDAVFRMLNPVGPTNVQLRKQDGIAYLLEINPRISSACSIRTQMGYNEPEMCVRHFLWKEALRPTVKRPGSAVRFLDDHVIDG
jgi:carbamoyl-phosphate synthase large subunit